MAIGTSSNKTGAAGARTAGNQRSYIAAEGVAAAAAQTLCSAYNRLVQHCCSQVHQLLPPSVQPACLSSLPDRRRTAARQVAQMVAAAADAF
jgi:hypothetical protein